jgi:hypothetical protein
MEGLFDSIIVRPAREGVPDDRQCQSVDDLKRRLVIWLEEHLRFKKETRPAPSGFGKQVWIVLTISGQFVAEVNLDDNSVESY